MSLLEKLGGEDAIDKILETFFSIFLKDPNCMSLFKNTELKDLKTYWKRFFYLITGGNEKDKEEYSVEALYKI